MRIQACSSSSSFSQAWFSHSMPLLKQIQATFFLFLVLYALFNAFFNPSDSSTFESTALPFNSTTASSIVLAANASKSPAVKVYLYDLPCRLTYRVIHHHSLVRGSRADIEEYEVSSLKYSGHQHMSEWYLFSDLARPDSERASSHVVQVLDPGEADLFLVPFFSSLSLIVNPVRPAGSGSGSEKAAYNDEENLEALVEWSERQEYWKRNKGRDHVIVASDPNAMSRVIDQVKNCVLLVSDFGWLRPDQGSLVKDVIVPPLASYKNGVATPAMNNILSKWIPVSERSRSLALVYSDMYLGSVTGLTFSHFLIQKFGWPSVFYSFGSLGSFWFVLWLRKAYNSPKDDPDLGEEEKRLILGGNIKRARVSYSLEIDIIKSTCLGFNNLSLLSQLRDEVRIEKRVPEKWILHPGDAFC